MKIAIIGAMPEEIELVREHMHLQEQKRIAHRTYHIGQMEGHEIICTFSRWGKVAAASTATTVIQHFGAELIIYTGVAGGIAKQVAIGDIVIASELLQHDVDASGTGLFAKFEIPLLGKAAFQVRQDYLEHTMSAANHFVDSALDDVVPIEQLQQLGIEKPTVHRGAIASGDQFISSEQIAKQLRAEIPDLLCVEMEGAAVAQVCYENGVDCVVIRSISDHADQHAALDFPKFVATVASYYSLGVVTELLKRLPLVKPALTHQ